MSKHCKECSCEYDTDFGEGYKKYFCTQFCHEKYYHNIYHNEFYYNKLEENFKMASDERLAFIEYYGSYDHNSIPDGHRTRRDNKNYLVPA